MAHVDPEVPDVLHNLHYLAIDGDGEMGEGLHLPPDVQDHLLCFCHVEDQVVLLAPTHQVLYLCPVCSVVVARGPAYHHGVICKF